MRTRIVLLSAAVAAASLFVAGAFGAAVTAGQLRTADLTDGR